MLVRQVFDLLAFRIKLLFLISTSLVSIYWPIEWQEVWAWTWKQYQHYYSPYCFPLMQSRTFRKVSFLVSLLINIEILTSLSTELLNFADFFFFLCHIWAFFWRYESCLRVTGTLESHPFQNLTIICVWYNKTGHKWIPFVETASTYNLPYPLKFSKILPFYPFLLPSQEPSKISSVQVNFCLYKST